MISLIIPCFHASENLHILAKDLINQDYSDFEVIFVNDGDSSQEKTLSEILSLDSKFRVVNKTNGGPASARNFGIDNAVGEWIVFADSDDRLSSHYLSSLYDVVKNNNVDIGIGGYYVSDLNRIEEIPLVTDSSLLKLENLLSIIENTTSHRAVWAKIYNTQLLKKNKLRFDERFNYAEDWLFNLNVFEHVKLIGCIKNCGYNYILNNKKGLIGSYFPNFIDINLICINQMSNIRKKIGRYENDIAIDKNRELSLMCFSYMKNLFCTRNSPSLSSSVSLIRKYILKNQHLLYALKVTKPHKKTDIIQKYIILTHNAWFIAITHKILYKIRH